MDKVISFTGTVVVEGDFDKSHAEELKDYLQRAVSLDLDVETEGQLYKGASVVGIGIDWESLDIA